MSDIVLLLIFLFVFVGSTTRLISFKYLKEEYKPKSILGTSTTLNSYKFANKKGIFLRNLALFIKLAGFIVLMILFIMYKSRIFTN
jgi:hypothetical protein